jgi:hypothetical protein
MKMLIWESENKMSKILINETMIEENIDPLMSLSPIYVKPDAGFNLAAMGDSEDISTSIVGSSLDEWAVGSACYMCHTCTNFGVQGTEGRPCAKGLSDLIKRRSKVRMDAQVARRNGN